MKRSMGLLLYVAAIPGWAAMALNPDVRQDTIQSTVCIPGYTKEVRPAVSYTNGVKLKLLRQQGLPSYATSDYELDHTVPLSVGGHPRALNNLRLQPWSEAKRKDRFEVKLQCLVCTGQVSLRQAQQDIYDDWEAAYHRYSRLKCSRR